MATDPPVKDATTSSAGKKATRRLATTGSVVRAALLPLTSLKLTVTLLAMGMFLVFAGTLALTRYDMWYIVHHYFRAWFVFIELQIFFPESFFPSKPQVPGGFFFPGGVLIGTMMAVNLVAAHGLRFKLQARGLRLVAGLFVLALGVVVTALVITAGQNSEGVQAQNWMSYDALWEVLNLGLFVLWLGTVIGAVVSFVKLDASRRMERWFLVVAALVLSGVVAYLFIASDTAQLTDPSMRILSQLIHATVAGLVLLAGCILAFKKRAGIVLIHLGIGLMMFNELWVGKTHTESQMILEEQGGRPDRVTANWVQDVRELELVLIIRGGGEDGKDLTIAIPESRLLQQTTVNGVVQYLRLTDERLPVEVQVIKFFRNSAFRSLSRGESTPLVDVGQSGRYKTQGRNSTIEEKRLVTGVDMNDENQPGAYVRFFDKETSKPISTHLVSVHQTFVARWAATELDRLEEVSVGGKTYEVYLRFKRINKPYRVTLLDVRRDNYIGTSEAQNYSSDIHVELIDEERGINVQSDVKVWMNNPFRFAGDTLYQSGYHSANFFRSELTIFSVVNNGGWMIPYVSCMIVAVGLLFQFGSALLRFMKRKAEADKRANEAATAAAQQASELAAEAGSEMGDPGDERDAATSQPQPASSKRRKRGDRVTIPSSPRITPPSSARIVALGRWFPLIIVCVFAAWVASKARPASTPDGDMNIYKAATLPISHKGRVKPFDSLARNSLRIISGREDFIDDNDKRKSLRWLLGEKRQPAIRWLLDVMSGSTRADDYKVFHIENLEVVKALNLERRKGYCYSLNEINQARNEFAAAMTDANAARKRNSRGLTLVQKKFIKLKAQTDLFYAIRLSHVVPPDENDSANRKVEFIINVAELSSQLDEVPFSAPLKSKQDPWESLTIAATRAFVQKMAAEQGAKTVPELRTIFLANLTMEEFENYVQLSVLQLLESVIESESKTKMSREEIHKVAVEKYHVMPEKMRASLEANARQNLSRQRAFLAAQFQTKYEQRLDASLRLLLGESRLTDSPDPAALTLAKMLRARRDDDVQSFNTALEEYEKILAENPPVDYDATKSKFEAGFNHFSPFYLACVLNVIAFVLVALSWLGWTRPLSRASFWLIVFSLTIHTLALISRIYISGRPPVTNLYSSAVFIGWGVVVLGLLFEVIYRNGIGNVLASVTGFAALLIAHFLSLDGDTITVLIAVLDTQFWLATHVVCITMGYGTTYGAGLLGIIYILRGVLTSSLTPTVRKDLGRMIYGGICFAIFFSFIGTVLGGLWADDSWGRFWGWDPKENGALIIVIWNAIVLHARWGGMVKDRGLAVLVIGGNIVTSWSWFGVNELGVGLHSYGFTQGVLMWLSIFVLSQLALIVVGSLPKSWWMSFGQSGNGEG